MTVERGRLERLTGILTREPTPLRDQAIRFLIVGASGYMLAVLLFAVLIELEVSPYVAVPPVFVLNGAYNFTLYRLWAFPRSRRNVGGETARFVTVAGLSLLVNYAALFVFFDLVDLDAVVAQAIAIAVAAPVGFFGNKFWTFAA